eukprot:1155446-Pelagomonas_calceolata.AAC.1
MRVGWWWWGRVIEETFCPPCSQPSHESPAASSIPGLPFYLARSAPGNACSLESAYACSHLPAPPAIPRSCLCLLLCRPLAMPTICQYLPLSARPPWQCLQPAYACVYLHVPPGNACNLPMHAFTCTSPLAMPATCLCVLLHRPLTMPTT